MQNTAPVDPAQTEATSFWNPGRSTEPEPERPRSSSMTVTDMNPSARAASAIPYCRRWLSVFSTTWGHGRLADVDDGPAAKVIRRDLRAHRAGPFLLPLRTWPCRAPRGADRPRLASTPRAGAPPGGAGSRAPAPGSVVFGVGLSSAASSLSRRSDVGGWAESGARFVSIARSSIRAAIPTCAGPAGIAAQAAASHIQAGTSRDKPARTST